MTGCVRGALLAPDRWFVNKFAFQALRLWTGHPTGLTCTTLLIPKSSALGHPTHISSIWTKPGPASISPCNITMDHDAIICSMIDRLRGVQIKMFTSRAWAT